MKRLPPHNMCANKLADVDLLKHLLGHLSMKLLINFNDTTSTYVNQTLQQPSDVQIGLQR